MSSLLASSDERAAVLLITRVIWNTSAGPRSIGPALFFLLSLCSLFWLISIGLGASQHQYRGNICLTPYQLILLARQGLKSTSRTSTRRMRGDEQQSDDGVVTGLTCRVERWRGRKAAGIVFCWIWSVLMRWRWADFRFNVQSGGCGRPHRATSDGLSMKCIVRLTR